MLQRPLVVDLKARQTAHCTGETPALPIAARAVLHVQPSLLSAAAPLMTQRRLRLHHNLLLHGPVLIKQQLGYGRHCWQIS